MTFAPVNAETAFVNIYKDFQVDDEQLRIRLTQIFTQYGQALNLKDIAVYDTVENQTGQQFFDPTNAQQKRLGFRKVFPFSSIVAGATLNTAHGITGETIFTRISGGCVTDVVDYRPLPYVDVAAVTNQISIRVDATNIIIMNGATGPTITNGIVILEYLKN